MTLMAFPSAPNNGDVSGKWIYDAASGAWVLNEGTITLANSTTDDLAEGVGNLYYTDARTDARITAAILDQDAMTSNSATQVPTQQSVKAYVDTVTSQIGTANFLGSALVTEAEGLASSDNDTSIPTTAAIKDYVDASILTKDNTDEITEGSANLYFTDARADARITAALIDEDNMASNSATRLPSQQSVKAYVDASILTKDNTDEITEGSANLYYTNARADARITAALIDEDAMTSNSATRLPSQQSVKAYVDGKTTKAAIDALGIVAASTTGNAATVTNGVYTTGNQTIAGTKTFSSTIIGNISGAAAAATTATDCSRTITAGSGLNGGGQLTADRTLNVDGDLRGVVTLIGADTNDYIQVGTTNMSFVLDGAVDARLFNNGEFHADGDVVAFSTSISDQRFKNQVTPIMDATETCKKLQGVEYTWNATGRKGKRDLGFIAQEIEKVLPNIVHTKTLAVGEWADSPMDAKTVDYEKLTAVLVEAVKELSARIDHLESN